MHFRFRTSRLTALVFLLAGFLCGAVTAQDVDNNLSPERASAALFERMSARDLDGVSRLIPPAGLSETGTDGSNVHHLDGKAFETLFKTELAIDLHAENLSARRINDVAIVTGVRTGAITPKGATPKPVRMLFSMVWLMDGQGSWKLHHLHVSPL